MLRRMTHALREQNWATIVIEFVLLVGGVFLGIQAANWNATQQEHALEAEFVERLQRDFRAIDARLAESVTRWQQKTVAPVRLLADLEVYQRHGAWPRTHADILRDLNDTLNGRIPAPRASTYVELLSAGKLGLIRDTRLRAALLDYDVQTGFTMKAYDVLVQRTDPHMPTLIAHLEYDRRLVDSKVAEAEASRTGAVWVDVDLAQLAADPALKVALNMYASSSSNQLQVALLQQEKAVAVTALLEPGVKRPEGAQP
ncbi:MAG: hypothetical protein H7147_08275 [Frankiaceae bacterium]|nr:hypothetical protein [Arenimonas sp.]